MEPVLLILVPLGTFAVMTITDAVVEQSLSLALWGAGGLAAFGAIRVLVDTLARPHFLALEESIAGYLETIPLAQVVHQATSPGPCLLGREYLFAHLDGRDGQWSQRCQDQLAALVQSKEIPKNQADYVRRYLGKKHPELMGANRTDNISKTP